MKSSMPCDEHSAWPIGKIDKSHIFIITIITINMNAVVLGDEVDFGSSQIICLAMPWFSVSAGYPVFAPSGPHSCPLPLLCALGRLMLMNWIIGRLCLPATIEAQPAGAQETEG